MNINQVKDKMQREIGESLSGGKLEVLYPQISEHDTFSCMASCKDESGKSTHLVATYSNLFVITEVSFFGNPNIKRLSTNAISFVESPTNGVLEIGVGARTYTFKDFYSSSDLKKLLSSL